MSWNPKITSSAEQSTWANPNQPLNENNSNQPQNRSQNDRINQVIPPHFANMARGWTLEHTELPNPAYHAKMMDDLNNTFPDIFK